MIITDIKPVGKKRFQLYLDGNIAFILYKADIKSYNLTVNSEISEECYKDILSSVLAKRALLRTLHLLEKKDYTEGQLRKKLREGFYPQEITDKTMDSLKGYGYLNDEKYALRYIEYKSNSKSERAIRQDLMIKGIKSEVIDMAFDTFREENPDLNRVDLICRLLTKRHYFEHEPDEKEKAKQYRFLAGKGFDSGDIKKALNLDINS